MSQGAELQIGWFDANLLFFLLMRLDGVPWQKALWAFLGVTIGSPKWKIDELENNREVDNG